MTCSRYTTSCLQVTSALLIRQVRRASFFFWLMLDSMDFLAEVVSPSSRLAFCPEVSESCTSGCLGP